MLSHDYKRFVKALIEAKNSYSVDEFRKGMIYLYSDSFNNCEHDLEVFERNGFKIMHKKLDFVGDSFSIVIC